MPVGQHTGKSLLGENHVTEQDEDPAVPEAEGALNGCGQDLALSRIKVRFKHELIPRDYDWKMAVLVNLRAEPCEQRHARNWSELLD